MEERLNALEIALNNEMNEHKFYVTNAERSKNPVGRAMFTQIAGEELEHYERLKQLSESWKKNNKWPDTVPLKVKNTEVKSIFFKAAKATGGNAGRGRESGRTAGDSDGDRIRSKGGGILRAAQGSVSRSEGEGVLRTPRRYRA